jgi:hypothetical protein
MLHRLTIRAAMAGALVLAGLLAPGLAGAQALPADVFKIERFAHVNSPNVSDDATVRITNPGSTGLRAWGTHAEGAGVITETPFQDATLSSSELGVLTEKCGGIVDNGSGHGICGCGPSAETTAPAGTLCALIYVFTADQQLAECCGCPVTPNGLLTLSVTNDLTSNSLTGVKPQRGVIKLLSSAGASPCDPTAPQLPAGPTTTTVPSATTTSTTTTTHPGSGSGANVGVRLCATGSISPPLERFVVRSLNGVQSRLDRAQQKGRHLNRVVRGGQNTLSVVEQKIHKAAKHRRIDASCQAALEQQIASLRGEMTALHQ